MPTPRPYGIGPYGTGYYSRYRGEIYEVAGASSLHMAAIARGVNRIITLEAPSDGISFAAHATAGFVYDLHAGITGIAWSLRARGVQRLVNPQALSSITLRVFAEHFAGSWIAPPAHEIGTWTPADPCETGLWTPPAAPEPGGWPSAYPCEPGVWAAPAAPAQGSWTITRIP